MFAVSDMFAVYDVFTVVYSFVITDLTYNGEGGEYLVNLNMSVCLEPGQPCHPVVPVFINSVLPKEVCNRNQDFRDKGGYLSLS
jgi:hypothetical protein